jgi:hypothetical protein
MKMNRQARKVGQELWCDYGDVSLVKAAEIHAARFSCMLVQVEVRCEGNPSIPVQVFDVEVRKVATVINPRSNA